MEFTRELKEFILPHPVQHRPYVRNQLLTERSVEDILRWMACAVAEETDISYLPKLGYYGRATCKKSLIRLVHSILTKYWTSEMLAGPNISDNSGFLVLPDSIRLNVWGFCDSDFGVKQL